MPPAGIGGPGAAVEAHGGGGGRGLRAISLDAELVRPVADAEESGIASAGARRVLHDAVVQARLQALAPAYYGHGVRTGEDGVGRERVHHRGAAEKVTVHVEGKRPWPPAQHLDLHLPQARGRRAAHYAGKLRCADGANAPASAAPLAAW